jgi:hypothetical protein
MRVAVPCLHRVRTRFAAKLDTVVGRVRVWEPLPHDFVHANQDAKGLTMQSAAQACTLHVTVSFEKGHAAPP